MIKFPSDQFDRAFPGGGSSSSTVCNCGRTHFSDEYAKHGYDDDDEGDLLEHYKELVKESPDKYVLHEGQGIGYNHIDDRVFVWGCPCNMAVRYEDFIWDNRDNILEYLRFRIPLEKFTAMLTMDKEAIYFAKRAEDKLKMIDSDKEQK